MIFFFAFSLANISKKNYLICNCKKSNISASVLSFCHIDKRKENLFKRIKKWLMAINLVILFGSLIKYLFFITSHYISNYLMKIRGLYIYYPLLLLELIFLLTKTLTYDFYDLILSYIVIPFF